MRQTLYRAGNNHGGIDVYLDDEDGAIYLNIETTNNGGVSFSLNELQRRIDEFEEKRQEQKEDVDREQIFDNFMKALDNVLKII